MSEMFDLGPGQLCLLEDTERGSPDGIFHQQILTYDIRGEIDHVALTKALEILIAQHDIFRAAIIHHPGEKPQQRIHATAGVPLERLDWSGLPPAEVEAKKDALRQQKRAQLLRLDSPPLMDLTLIKVAPDHHELVWMHNHMTFDGIGRALSLLELEKNHARLKKGEEPLPPSPSEQERYVRWCASKMTEADAAFWRERLAGCRVPTPISLPTQKPLGDNWRTRTGRPHFSAAGLSVEESRALRQSLRTNRATFGSAVCAAWALALRKYSGENKVIMGLAIQGGLGAGDLAQKIGMMMNFLPVVVTIDEAAPVKKFLRSVWTELLNVSEKEYVSRAQIYEWCGVPLEKVMWHGIIALATRTPSEESALFTPVDFDMNAYEPLGILPVQLSDDSTTFFIDYDHEYFAFADIERAMHDLARLTVELVRDPNRSVRDVVDAAERSSLKMDVKQYPSYPLTFR